MRFQMVVTDGNRRLVVPFSKRQICDLSDIWWFFDEQDWKDIKLNKMEETITSCQRKFHFLCHDVLHGGTTYKCVFDEKGEFTGKTIKQPGSWYFVRKPRWINDI